MFWRPEIAPASVILLAPATPFAANNLILGLEPSCVRSAEEGEYVRLADGSQLLLLDGACLDAGVTVLLPLDGDFDIRAAAAQALHQRALSAVGSADSLSGQRRWRLRRMMRAFDGQVSGASYREVADGVLGEAFSDSISWRTSSARDVAIRLCRNAAKLVRDGYLALLRRAG